MGNDKHEKERRVATKKSAAGYDTVWVDFDQEDIDAVRRQHSGEPIEPLVWLAGCASAGWKLGFNWSVHYGAYILSLTCNVTDHPCFKQVYLVRHSDFFKALSMLAYVWRAKIDPVAGFLDSPQGKDAW